MAAAPFPPALTQPETYQQLFLNQGDALNGNYAALLDCFTSTGLTALKLQNQVLNASKVVPKVFLCMVEISQEPYNVALHHPALP